MGVGRVALHRRAGIGAAGSWRGGQRHGHGSQWGYDVGGGAVFRRGHADSDHAGRHYMSHPPKWAVGQSYLVGDLVTHEGVEYVVETAHFSSVLNEPDAVTDTAWQPYWTSTTPTWGDFLYGRIPAWLRTLDAQHQNSL